MPTIFAILAGVGGVLLLIALVLSDQRAPTDGVIASVADLDAYRHGANERLVADADELVFTDRYGHQL